MLHNLSFPKAFLPMSFQDPPSYRLRSIWTAGFSVILANHAYKTQVGSQRRATSKDTDRTNLKVGKFVHTLNSRVSVDADPWENIDIRNAIFATSGTREPVAIFQPDIKNAIQTFGLVEVSCVRMKPDYKLAFIRGEKHARLIA